MHPPHPWLAGVLPVAHGGNAGDLVDLSASLAPLGPSPAAVAAAREAALGPYPSPDAAPLVAAAARQFHISPEWVVAGPGAADLLLRACLAHLRPGDRALLVAPCFGEYARAVAACGAEVVEWRTDRRRGFAVDVAAVAAAARGAGAAVGLLARPANPTGVALSRDEVAALVAATPQTTWIVDEAFVGLSDDPRSSAGLEAVVVRSLTKELALAGLRVAVAAAPPETAAALRALSPPWPVAAPALAAAVAGLADATHRSATAAAVRRGRRTLTATFEAAGVATTAATANFVCAAVADTAEGGAAFVAAIRRRGVAVRDCTDFGLAGWVRLAVPPPERLDDVAAACLAALAEVRRAPEAAAPSAPGPSGAILERRR